MRVQTSGRKKWRARESHPASKAYETSMSTGSTRVVFVFRGYWVAEELNLSSDHPACFTTTVLQTVRGGTTRFAYVRPALAESMSRVIARVGVEPTDDHEVLSFAALPVCAPRRNEWIV